MKPVVLISRVITFVDASDTGAMNLMKFRQLLDEDRRRNAEAYAEAPQGDIPTAGGTYAEVQELLERNQALQLQCDEAAASMANLKAKFEQTQAQVRGLTEDNAHLQSRLANLKDKHRGELDELRHKLAEARDALALATAGPTNPESLALAGAHGQQVDGLPGNDHSAAAADAARVTDDTEQESVYAAAQDAALAVAADGETDLDMVVALALESVEHRISDVATLDGLDAHIRTVMRSHRAASPLTRDPADALPSLPLPNLEQLAEEASRNLTCMGCQRQFKNKELFSKHLDLSSCT